MATEAAVARRRAEAEGAISDCVSALAAKCGVKVAVEPILGVRDLELKRVMQLEGLTAALRQILDGFEAETESENENQTEENETDEEKADEETLTEAALSKMKKAKLVALASDLGISVTPDSETVKQIIAKILEAQENNAG